MPEYLNIRKELKEKFIRDLNLSEKILFLKKAKEAILLKRYRASEDLFHYCYFLIIKERFRSIAPQRDDGLLRFILAEGSKDVEEAIKTYEARLEENKLPVVDEEGIKFIEYFSE